MAFGYRYTLEPQENGWYLVRFPGIPEALTEGEGEGDARGAALDCIITALEGYMKAGKALPRDDTEEAGSDRVALPSLATAKLCVYEAMRASGWSRVRLAHELAVSENAVRRLLDLRHNSHLWVIDAALAKMDASLLIELPAKRAAPRAA